MLEKLKDKEMLRIAAAVCIGLVGAQVVTTILRLAFYDRYREEWHYGWMIAVAVIVTAGYRLLPKVPAVLARVDELLSKRNNQVIACCAAVAVVLLYMAIAIHFAAPSRSQFVPDNSTFTPILPSDSPAANGAVKQPVATRDFSKAERITPPNTSSAKVIISNGKRYLVPKDFTPEDTKKFLQTVAEKERSAARP